MLEFLEPAVAFHGANIVLPAMEVRTADNPKKTVQVCKKGVSMAAAMGLKVEARHADRVDDADREVCTGGRSHDHQLLPVLHAFELDGHLDALLRPRPAGHPVWRQVNTRECFLGSKEGCHLGYENILR